MRFIHTSDWHLGRQFHNVSLLDDQKHVLQQIVGYLQSEQADALVIAGDIYDRSVPPAAAVELLDEVINHICEETGLPILIISGNHDSAERLSFAARQLQRAGVHIFADLEQVTRPVSLCGRSGVEADFYGIPYCDPEQVRHQFDTPVANHNQAHTYLVEKIKTAHATSRHRVLISHCFVDGAEESESERPLAVGGADRVDYQPMSCFSYVALGHLHGPQQRALAHIRYSGSILKYSFSEQHHKKAATLVEIDAQGQASTRQLPLQPLRNMRVIEGEMEEVLAAGRLDPHADDYLLVRLTDRHAILDAMGKLRRVYPNVLHLEKPGIMTAGDSNGLSRERLQRGELAMFRDFYQQIAGAALTDAQDEALQALLDRLQRETK